MHRPRVLLADDHRLVVEACVSLLEPECKVLGIVADGRTLLSTAVALRIEHRFKIHQPVHSLGQSHTPLGIRTDTPFRFVRRWPIP